MNKFVMMLVLMVCSSCSVIMAAKKEGTSLESIQTSRTRGQILSQGAIVVSSERNDDGDLVEVYQFQKPRGSAARAFMHGVLDVSTCGVWEVVGTPIEASLDQKEYFCLRVTYDPCEVISRIELL